MYSATHVVGGQSIPKFDYDLAIGVKKTFINRYIQNMIRGLMFKTGDDKENITELINNIHKEIKEREGIDPILANDNGYQNKEREMLISKYFNKLTGSEIEEVQKTAYNLAKSETDRSTYQAMEALIHNLNTMNSRAGCQTPFSSINYGTDTSPEGRMVIKNILLALEAGLGHGETPIFPIHIFKVKEGVNYNLEDPNYDMFKLACRVSAKRLFPNFSFIDSSFNLKYYKEGNPDTEISYMGCVQSDEVVTYKFNDKLYVESISRFWDRMFANMKGCEVYGESRYINTSRTVKIFDSNKNDFVDCKKIILNPNKNNWVQIKMDNGRNLTCTLDHPLPVVNSNGDRMRKLVKDLKIGDKIPVTYAQYSEESEYFDIDEAWLLGLLVCDSNYDSNIVASIGIDETDIIEKLIPIVNKNWNCWVGVKDMREYTNENYYQVSIHADRRSDEKLNERCKYLRGIFGGNAKKQRQLPSGCFGWNIDARYSLLAGLIDADGYCTKDSRGTRVMLGSTNKELALQEMLLAQSLGFACKMYISTYSSTSDNLRYRIEFGVNGELYKHMASAKKKVMKNTDNGFEIISTKINSPELCTVTSIEFVEINECSFDVETESDMFDVSGILSHNCRTRVIGNVHDPSREIVTSRGNLSFTSINLPRLAIEAHGDINKFFKSLDDMMDLVIDQLKHRFKIQCQKFVYNFPFLMGQGVWIDSEKLGNNDCIEEVLKHGSLSVGFIGLAECLVALIGKHHGESKEAQELGLKIVKHMRERTDEEAEKTKLNFTLLATPAEGLSSRFVRIDRKRYGIIPGVTDRDYHTNSFHVPVYFHISAFEKIKIEAPYHELTNAGHISYIELDGDPTENLGVFEKIVRCMKEYGIGYGAINHPVDRDPICGYSGIIYDECPCCGRKEHDAEIGFERLRRITGYLTTSLEKWNDGKRAEERDRVKHNI